MVLLFLAEGFEEIEALAPVDILRRAGIEVVTAGVGTRVVTGAHGIPVTADMTAEEALPLLGGTGPEALILPGGMPGTRHLEQAAEVQAAIDAAVRGNALLCAICAAPSILGRKGLLQGKRAVCYPGYEDACKGAVIADDPVVVDGRLVTARGAGAALLFALRIVEELRGAAQADALRTGMCCPEAAVSCE